MSTENHAANHEEAFVKSFITKGYRERLSFELKKRRGDFLGRFCHDSLLYLDPRFIFELPKPNSDRIDVCRELKLRGAKDSCYAISMNEDVDRKTLKLADALAGVVGFGLASILSCVSGELAYLETEQISGAPNRFILSRSGSS
jgi:hypothetical protein